MDQHKRWTDNEGRKTRPLIDTLTLETGLLEGGMPEPQAAAIVGALADADVG